MKFYGQFDPPVDKVIYEKYFPQKTSGTCIECGAGEGILENSCKFFEESMGWKSINIEASPCNFKKLVVNRPTSLNFNLALSDKNGISTFNDVRFQPGEGDFSHLGSLSHQEAQLCEIKANHWTLHPVQVETITYASFIEKYEIHQVDLLVLDVEGCELQAIAGMRGSKIIPKVMCVEYSYSGLEENKAALAQMGFRLDFTLFVNAFFVRD